MLNSKKFKEWIRVTISELVLQVVVTCLLTIGGGALSYFVTTKLLLSEREKILITILVISLIGVACAIIYILNNKNLLIFAPNPDFLVLKEERIHKWLDKDKYLHRRRYKLRALKNGMREFEDKFKWTGTTYQLTGGSPHYKIDRRPDKNLFECYSFKFNRPLKKGQEIEVEATWKAQGPAANFVSTDIARPTKELLIKVMLYPASGVKKVTCEISLAKGASAIEYIDKELNSDGETEWSVEPKILHHYEINWEIPYA